MSTHIYYPFWELVVCDCLVSPSKAIVVFSRQALRVVMLYLPGVRTDTHPSKVTLNLKRFISCSWQLPKVAAVDFLSCLVFVKEETLFYRVLLLAILVQSFGPWTNQSPFPTLPSTTSIFCCHRFGVLSTWSVGGFCGRRVVNKFIPIKFFCSRFFRRVPCHCWCIFFFVALYVCFSSWLGYGPIWLGFLWWVLNVWFRSVPFFCTF